MGWTNSCVEQSVQRLFLAISAHLDLCIHGSDVPDAFVHVPGPSVFTFVSIDDQFSGFYRQIFGNNIDKDKVLPVLRYLQGHQESSIL